MGMNVVIEALIRSLNRHREHLDDETIALIDKLVEADKQPVEEQKDILYRADHRLRRDLGDEEYFRRARSSN